MHFVCGTNRASASNGSLHTDQLDGLDTLAVAAVTIGVAALSWHLFERPLNDLKRCFPYTAKRMGEPHERSLSAPPAPASGTLSVLGVAGPKPATNEGDDVPS